MIARSACGVIWLVSVASLGVGSATPGGFVAVTVLTSCPVASGGTVPDKLNVTDWPASIDTVVLMEPVPLGAAPLAAGVHVQVAFVKIAGMTSVTVTPTTSLGPLFVTTMVYVVEVPGTMVVFPSSFVTVRSAMSAPSVTDAEPLLLAVSGSGVGLETT